MGTHVFKNGVLTKAQDSEPEKEKEEVKPKPKSRAKKSEESTEEK